ncbi:MAG: fibronectin type III domain-containing protein [Spirochaetaceae bacterium]|nr:fibronectin type III domain-containing protein [Spirochaetaceae bacterium]
MLWLLICALFAASGSLFALGEKTLTLGGAGGWAEVKDRRGVTGAAGYRPHEVLILDSGAGPGKQAPDLFLNFDEGRPEHFADASGRYSLLAAPELQSVTGRRARLGAGAVLFNGASGVHGPEGNTLVISPIHAGALLAQDARLGDFSLEFWLNPANMETGEEILYWSAVRPFSGGAYEAQWIQCVVSRNRLRWTFHNFFAGTRDERRLSVSFTGLSVVTPRTWSFHRIRFDAETGMLEYLVDGRSESIVYLTSTGREGSEVYTPIVGRGSRLILGGRYSGLIDEFSLRGSSEDDDPAGEPAGRGLQKFPPRGWVETACLDLGEPQSRVLGIDARGGLITRPGSGAPGEALPEALAGTGGSRFLFPDDSAIRFYVRCSDIPRPEGAWLPASPGAPLNLRGRYVQIRAEFYPSGDGENTPYLDEISLTWLANEAPRPPARLAATALDGAVELSWSPGADTDVEGYLVYYGTGSGEYFGTGAAAGPSPIDAGKRTSLRIGGLNNGVLYYFAVSAYDETGTAHAGAFSREVSARPLRMIE